MQLSKNFTLGELTVTSHRDIDNTPPDELLGKLTYTAAGLEHVRLLLGVPVIVLSGYRCPELNCVVGGAMARDSLQRLVGVIKNEDSASIALKRIAGGAFQFTDSQHMAGEACDFVAPKFGTPYEICCALEASDLRFDQMIFEGTWVHVSFVDDKVPRRSILTWRKGHGYDVGLIA